MVVVDFDANEQFGIFVLVNVGKECDCVGPDVVLAVVVVVVDADKEFKEECDCVGPEVVLAMVVVDADDDEQFDIFVLVNVGEECDCVCPDVVLAVVVADVDADKKFREECDCVCPEVVLEMVVDADEQFGIFVFVNAVEECHFVDSDTGDLSVADDENDALICVVVVVVVVTKAIQNIMFH